MTVGAEKRDAVAASGALGTECAGEAGRAIGKLSIGEVLVPTNNRQIIAKLLARIAEKADRRQRNIHVALLQRLMTGRGSSSLVIHACNASMSFRTVREAANRTR